LLASHPVVVFADWRPLCYRDGNALEFVDAVHALGLLGRIYKAAERCLELLTTRAMSHTAQTWAVPIDLACLWVECTLLICLFFKSFYAALAIL
jgi:hypothetical protein